MGMAVDDTIRMLVLMVVGVRVLVGVLLFARLAALLVAGLFNTHRLAPSLRCHRYGDDRTRFYSLPL